MAEHAERFALIVTTRRVLPVAFVIAMAGVVFSQPFGLRVACAVVALLAIALWLWQWRAQPSLVVDDEGYAVEEHGREKLRVAWSEVKRVLADSAEHALYVDCGDRARNLLVPPRRGFGFRFERAAELYVRICERVPDRVEQVERLDGAGKKKDA